MIIDEKELQKVLLLEKDHKKYLKELRSDEPILWPHCYISDFFLENPHLLMLLGFDEFKYIMNEEKTLFREYFDYSSNQMNFPESWYRIRESGIWKRFLGICGGTNGIEPFLLFIEPYSNEYYKDENKYSIPFQRLINVIKEAIIKPPTNPSSILLPASWTYNNQIKYKINFVNNIRSIIHEISINEKSLNDLHPRQFEELIATLLQDKGMDIYLTPYTRDGGRDVIARGELIPGEPCVMAIEVKRKKTTGLADLQRALYANKDFPCLLLATSGRFSAGVINEKAKPENEYRLLLKDGVAIKQWISMYNVKNNILLK